MDQGEVLIEVAAGQTVASPIETWAREHGTDVEGAVRIALERFLAREGS